MTQLELFDGAGAPVASPRIAQNGAETACAGRSWLCPSTPEGRRARWDRPGARRRAGVVDHERQAGLALGRAPADELVAWGHLPGAGAKAQHGQRVRLAAHDIAHLCSRQRGIAEVMVAVHVLAPERRGGALGDRAHV